MTAVAARNASGQVDTFGKRVELSGGRWVDMVLRVRRGAGPNGKDRVEIGYTAKSDGVTQADIIEASANMHAEAVKVFESVGAKASNHQWHLGCKGGSS